MSTFQAVPTRRPLVRLLTLGRPVRLSLLVAVGAGAATVGAGIALLAVSGFLLARASQHPNIVALSIAVVAVRALGVTRGLTRYVERLAGHDAALRVLADLRAAIYARLERLAPAGLSGFRAGDLLTRFVADVDAVQDLFIRGVTPPLVAAAAGGAAVLLSTALWSSAGVALAAGLLLAGVVLPVLSATLVSRTAEATTKARGELAVCSVELVDGAAELTALGAESTALARVEAADTTLTRMALRSAAVAALGSGGAALVSGLTGFAVLLLGVRAADHGSLGAVPLAVLVLTALAAFEATSALPATATTLVSVRASARRIFSVLDAPLPVTDPDAASDVTVRTPVSVSMRGVVAGYPGGPDVLRALDLDLPPGRRVAVIGASGAGKSTLVAVLLRQLDLRGGEYRINGIEATAMSGDTVRHAIGGCTADPHIFDSTLRANLTLAAPSAADDRLREALAMVKLERWLDGNRDGLDTLVGAHGLAMSGGERQRLAVARALLAAVDLVVLDEPTAHLDTETAEELMADVLSAVAGRSLLLITHDRRGLSHIDEVYELRDGRLARLR